MDVKDHLRECKTLSLNLETDTRNFIIYGIKEYLKKSKNISTRPMNMKFRILRSMYNALKKNFVRGCDHYYLKYVTDQNYSCVDKFLGAFNLDKLDVVRHHGRTGPGQIIRLVCDGKNDSILIKIYKEAINEEVDDEEVRIIGYFL